MASPVLARVAVLEGRHDLGSVPLRTWEFMNYYEFDYPAADPGTIRLHAAMVPQPEVGPDAYALQIGVAAPEVTSESRANLNLTWVLDTSCSMDGSPMQVQKEAGLAAASQLKAGDVVSMVTWSTTRDVILDGYTVTRPNDPVLVSAFEELAAGGGTDLNAGLTYGYYYADINRSDDMVNRVVLVSDGGANAGVTEAEIIANYAGNRDEDGIYMVGLGVGTASTYDPELMDTVTDMGRGASIYADSSAEVWKTMGSDFINTMDVAARDVQVRLDLPPGFEIVRFSGEEFSADPTEIEPQHLAPNDSMVFLQTIETCAPEQVSDDTEVGIIVTWKDPVTFEAKELTLQLPFAELMGADQTLLYKGLAIYEYAESLKIWRDRDVPTTERAAAILKAADAVDIALTYDPDDIDLAEVQVVLDSLE
ncbi:MAG: hypothetical protein CL927_00450 [Deltaproteobacteria bacterium]|nr:hypothetical protein [Deltaproteobacteria bacterium]